MSVFDFIIRFKSDGVDQMANTVKGKLGRISREMGGMVAGGVLGYVGVEAIKARVAATIRYVTSIKDLSEQTGASTDRLQEWDFAANQMGMSIQDVVTAFNRFKLAREAALSGKAGNQDATDFSALGISGSDLKKMGPEEAFNRVGRALANVSDESDTARMSVNLFGREGIKFTNALRNGFMDSGDKARAMGIVIGNELVEQIDAAEKKMDAFALRSRTAIAGLIGGVMKFYEAAVDFGGGAQQAMWEWWYSKTNQSEGGALDKDGHLTKLAKTDKAKAFVEGVENSVKAQNAAEADVPQNKNEITAPGPVTPQKSQSSGSSVSQADALARIGLFRGGAGPSQTTLLQTQIKQLTQVVEQLKSVNGNLTDES